MTVNGNGNHGVSVKEAATELGISPRAVRFRIKAGSLKAQQLAGQWLVYLNEETPVTEEDYRATDGNGKEPEERSLPQGFNPQFQAIMDTWLSPLTEKISRQSEEIGQLKAQNEQLEREKVALIEALDGDSTYPEEPRPGFWTWLFGR